MEQTERKKRNNKLENQFAVGAKKFFPKVNSSFSCFFLCSRLCFFCIRFLTSEAHDSIPVLQKHNREHQKKHHKMQSTLGKKLPEKIEHQN